MNGDGEKETKSSLDASKFEVLNAFDGSGDKEEFEITKKEFDQIKDALGKEQFRKLLVDYVEDVQSPESQKTYQKEVRELELEKGNIVHFLNPIPGYVLKTSVDGEKKGFINICSNPLIKKASVENASKGNKKGSLWSIPFAQSPAHEDLDKTKSYCVVYDVIFHPDSIKLANSTDAYREKIEEVAIEGIESTFKVKLDRNNLKRPNLEYKGAPRAIVIKYKIGDPIPSIIDQDAIKNELPPQSYKNVRNEVRKTKVGIPNKNVGKKEFQDSKQKFTAPKYSYKYRSKVDIQDCCIDNQKRNLTPDEVILTIDLPLLSDSSGIDADVLENGWDFELMSKTKAFYELKLKLPYQVVPESSNAKFDKDKRKLHVTMQTLNVKIPFESVLRQHILDENEVKTELEGGTSFSDGGVKDAPIPKLIEEIEEKDVGYESTESIENVPIVINGNIVVKSILKGGNQSVRGRSMSESCYFDHHYKEDYYSLESLSESNEVLTEETTGSSEKSVRFNDTVKRQLYRSNSSILGQRKKNQKRNKSKKKNRDRHNSEGSASSFDEDHEASSKPHQPLIPLSNPKQKPIKSSSLD